MMPNRAVAIADCPLSLWMIWVTERLPSLRNHSLAGVAPLWIPRCPESIVR